MLPPETGKRGGKRSDTSFIWTNSFIGQVPIPKRRFFACLFYKSSSFPALTSVCVPFGFAQRASATGTPTLVTLTWMRGWRRAIAAAASATAASTTPRGSTASAASWASTGTSGSPSLPQTPANVSQRPATACFLKGKVSDERRDLLAPPRSNLLASVKGGEFFESSLWYYLQKAVVIFAGWKSADAVDKSVPRISAAWGQGRERINLLSPIAIFGEENCILFSCSPCSVTVATSESGSSASRSAADK